MSDPTPYLHFAGTARDALTWYADIFGGAAVLHTFEEFGRTDGPGEAIAHGGIQDGPVVLFGADVALGEPAFRAEGLMLSLLGTAPPEDLHRWFDRLAEGGRVVDELQERPWGDTDGQVLDRYGVLWLVGYQPDLEA